MHTVTADELQVHMTMPQAEVQETPDTNLWWPMIPIMGVARVHALLRPLYLQHAA